MNNSKEIRTKTKRIIGLFCVSAFIITALTSIPLFVNYLQGSSPKFQLIVDLHVWFGLIFIIIASIRMAKNKAFIN